ncbi:MAG: signal peptide peptidase SppA [Candidatus Cloacimonadota bacterium]|nr:signal peptide peptidase SppA [Candidatus Cloacimonadota bacterium]
MKKLLLFIILMNTFVLWGEGSYHNFSVAQRDDFLAPLVNPANIGFRNSNGFAYLGNYNQDKLEKNNYSLFFNLDQLSYVFQKAQQDHHLLNMGIDLTDNFYFGTSYDWTNSKYKEGSWNFGLLARPYNFISIGAVSRNTFNEDEINYRLGTAVRPVFLNKNIWNRLTLSLDMDYISNKWQKPVIGLKSELVDGILLGGSYSLETETAGINFGIRLSNLGIGNITNLDRDNKVEYGNFYLNFSSRNFRSFLNTHHLTKPDNMLYNLDMGEKIVEKNPKKKFGHFLIIFEDNTTVQEMVTQLRELKENDAIDGILIKSGNFSASFANINELKQAFLEFKSSGRKVVFYYDSIGNSNYAFAASVADKIYLNPGGSIDLKGVFSAVPYVKGLLDTLGVKMVNLQSHEYKTAFNMFSEKQMTPAEKEAYEYLLSGIYDEMVEMIESGRGDILKKPVTQIIDEGPYFIANEALEVGLVDGLIYQDQLEEKLEELYGETKVVKNVTKVDYVYDWQKPQKDKIAIIYALGNIHMGESMGNTSIGSETLAKQIKRAREDNSIKGIILRVDSVGGSALASEIIAREIKLCKSGENTKPVVVSMGGSAASGGYYISCYADKIFADPCTITGSIGVVGMVPDLSGLWEKVLVNWSVVKKGKNADFLNIHRGPSDNEINMLERSIEQTYNKFTSEVADGRNMSQLEVHKVAKGRIWTGKQAMERGLVDEVGGLQDALIAMKEMANLENEIELVDYSKDSGKIDLNLSFSSIGVSEKSIIPPELNSIKDMLENYQNYKDEKILYIMPYNFDFK